MPVKKADMMTAMITTPKVPCKSPARDVPGGSCGRVIFGRVGSALAVEDMSNLGEGGKYERCIDMTL